MAFIDDLLESGGNYVIECTDGVASLRPPSGRDDHLESFQNLARRVRDNAGDGYTVLREHLSSDRPGNLVDLMILAIDG